MTGRYEEKKKTKMRKGKIGLSDLSDLQMANKIRNWFFSLLTAITATPDALSHKI